MPFIGETGANHPGNKLYITEAPSNGRRMEFDMQGFMERAFKFNSRADAQNAAARFSSLYELTVVEIPKS